MKVSARHQLQLSKQSFTYARAVLPAEQAYGMLGRAHVHVTGEGNVQVKKR